MAEVMARQLMSPVKFSQSMEALLHSATPPAQALEVGPGSVLAGLLKRIARDVPVAATGDGESLRDAVVGYSSEGEA
jgi:[acyl-carrier-protein] S-malonyltransferase